MLRAVLSCPYGISAGLVVAVCVVTFLMATCQPRQATPPDLQRLVEAKDVDGLHSLAERALNSNLGNPLPAFILTGKDGERVPLSSFGGEKLAIFIAGGPCPFTLEWVGRLETAGWRVPGYKLITLVKMHGIPELETALQGNNAVFASEWPMPSFLTYLRFYPLMLFASKDGVFIGYQRPEDPHPILLKPTEEVDHE